MQARILGQDRLLEELSHCIILQNLTRPELRKFSAICEIRDYPAGELLVEQDSVGSDLHLLLEGSVDITVNGREKGPVKVSEVKKGDVLGEASIFTDLPRTASAIARVPCLVAAVPRDRLFAFCDRNPRAGLKLFAFVIFSMLRRLQSTTRELAEERESIVTRDDIDKLLVNMPKSLEGMLGAAAWGHQGTAK